MKHGSLACWAVEGNPLDCTADFLCGNLNNHHAHRGQQSLSLMTMILQNDSVWSHKCIFREHSVLCRNNVHAIFNCSVFCLLVSIAMIIYVWKEFIISHSSYRTAGSFKRLKLFIIGHIMEASLHISQWWNISQDHSSQSQRAPCVPAFMQCIPSAHTLNTAPLALVSFL